MGKNETTNSNWSEKKGSWLTYRPDIKVLDCTIRDGGLINNCNFEDDLRPRYLSGVCSSRG